MTIYGINEESISLPYIRRKKKNIKDERHDKAIFLQKHRIKQFNKKQDCHDKFISIQKHTTKLLLKDVVSLRNTYIHTLINPKTQSGYFAIMQYYTVQQPHMGSGCK